MKKMNLMTKLLFTFVGLVVGVLTLQGCGNNGGSDTTRSCDRDRELSNVIAQRYKGMNGTYSGENNNADVFLVVTTAKVNNPASLCVPLPTLAGNLVFSPRLVVGGSAIGGTAQRAKIYFPFTDGTYDQSSKGEFSFTVEKDTHPSLVTCKFTDTSTLGCTWNKGLSPSQFVLKRSPDDALEKLDQRSSKLFGGSYAGQVADFSVKAVFNPGLTTRPDSMVPQLNVIGSFTFVSNKKDPAGEAIEAPMPFNDGTYDVSTGTIVMTVVSENMGNIVVNCRVESTDVLDCRWLSRDAIEFKLKKVK